METIDWMLCLKRIAELNELQARTLKLMFAEIDEALTKCEKLSGEAGSNNPYKE